MFISPYDTTVGQRLKGVDRARTALETAYVGKLLSGPTGVVNSPVVELLTGKAELDDVPAFGHPITFKTVLDGKRIAVDQRPYARVPVNPEYAGTATDITNAREYRFMTERAWLQLGWEALPQEKFLGVSALPMRIFAEWIAGQVSQKLGLDPQQRRDLTIVCAWYWLCLFRSADIDGQDRIQMQRAIQSGLRYDFSFVAIITENLPFMANMETFVNALRDSGISLRLKSLNAALLFQITSFSWVGGYAKEVAGIALEHPPTFILLCVSGDNDLGYKDTIIGRLMREQRKLSRDTVDKFIMNVAHLLETCRGITRF